MITLRPIHSTDAPALAAAVAQSRDALRRWMAWYRDDYDVNSASTWIAASVASARCGTGVQCAILDDVGRQAIALAIARAQTQPAFKVAWAVVADANRASRRVLEVNGFRLIGARGLDERGDTALLYERTMKTPSLLTERGSSVRLPDSSLR